MNFNNPWETSTFGTTGAYETVRGFYLCARHADRFLMITRLSPSLLVLQRHSNQ
jgi:hypothetical protein